MLIEEILPVKTKSMQESRKTLHKYQNAHSENGPGSKNEEENDRSVVLLLCQTDTHDHAPQHFRELCVN